VKNINYSAVNDWLFERNIIPEKGFSERLKIYAGQAKKSGLVKTADEFYRNIGARKEYLTYWRYNDYSAQSKRGKDKKKLKLR
jgi:hypothetical protein